MNIALIGYGKMGHMIETICKERGHNIVCIIDVDNQQDFDSPEFASADVAIEFTSPTAAYANYLRAFKAGVKVVSGSTGWKTMPTTLSVCARKRARRSSGLPTSPSAWQSSPPSTVISLAL